MTTFSTPSRVTSADASSLPQSCHTSLSNLLNRFLFVTLISSMAEKQNSPGHSLYCEPLKSVVTSFSFRHFSQISQFVK